MKALLSSRQVREAPAYTMVHVYDADRGGKLVGSGRLRVRSEADADAALKERDLPVGPVIEAAISFLPEYRGKGLGAAMYAAIVEAVAPLPLVASSLLPEPWGKTSAGSWSVWRSARLAALVDVRDGVARLRPPEPPDAPAAVPEPAAPPAPLPDAAKAVPEPEAVPEAEAVPEPLPEPEAAPVAQPEEAADTVTA